jgi:hypothetical protein
MAEDARATDQIAKPQKGEGLKAHNRKRHCWECFGRNLVCDFERPGCRRCASSGIGCPGYGETKPRKLKWLTPGQVNSRVWKRSSPPKEKVSRKCSPQNASPPKEASSSATKSQEQETTIATSFEDVVIPSSELKTTLHAIMDAIRYCTYSS